MKNLIVIFLVAANYVLVDSSRFPVCEPENVSWHPHPFSCEQYFMCFWGELILRHCAPGLHYNRVTTQCMLPELAGCTLETEIYCPTPDNPSEIVFQPDPDDCSRYYVCFNGDPIERDCAYDFWWDINNNWCTFPDQVTCDNRTLNNPNDPNRTTVTTLSPTTTTTTTSTTTTTIPTTTRNPNIFDCPVSPETTLHPHTQSCWRYFICISGIAFLRDCATGMLFDTVTRNCAPFNEAVCYPGASTDRRNAFFI